MKISSNFNNLFLNVKTNNFPNKKYPNLSPLKADTFSFCGNITEEKNPIETESIRECLSSFGITKANEKKLEALQYGMQGYKKFLAENRKQETFELIKDSELFKGQYSLEKYVFHIAKLSDMMELIKRMADSYLTHGVYRTKCEEIIDYYPLADIFFRENGFNVPKDVNKYVQLLYDSNPEAGKYIAKNSLDYLAVPMYSALRRKEDLTDFAPILMNYALDTGTGLDMGVFDPNTISEFLRKIGLDSMYDFGSKFDYLASRYNDFNTTDDLRNLVDDFRAEYPEKIKFLQGMALKYPDKMGNNREECERIYARHCNIADYIFSKQNSKNYFDKEPFYIDFLVNFDKLSAIKIKQLSEINDLEDSESVYGFMELLAESEITIPELIFMAQNSFVSNNSLFDCIINKNDIVSEIASVEDISQEEAENIYLNFANEYCALIKEAKNNENKSDVFDGLLNRDTVIEDFTKFLKSYGFLDKIVENTGSSLLKDLFQGFNFNNSLNSKKQINSDKFADIIGLFRLFDSKEKIIEEFNSTAQNTEAPAKPDKKISKRFEPKNNNGSITPNILKRILENEKINFNKLKPLIEHYLNSDESDFYSNLSVLEIYKLYKRESKQITDTKFHSQKEELSEDDIKRINENLINVLDFYKKGLSFDVSLSNALGKLVPDKQLIKKFLIRNNISLNSNNPARNEEYINNAIKILSLFKGDEDNFKDAIEYFCKTDFIKLSQNELSDFFEEYRDEAFQREIFKGIANAKVKNLQEFNSFIKKYSDKNGNIDNLVKLLNNLPPEINLQTLVYKFLAQFKKFMEMYNIDIEIDNSNIACLNPEKIKPFENYKISEIINLINAVSQAKEGYNFISSMPKLTIPKSQNVKYTSKDIASEYITYRDGGLLHDKIPYNCLPNLFEPNEKPQEEFKVFEFSKEKYRIRNQIPTDFIKLLNDYSWLKVDEENIFNMTLHAKMRFIDRFIMPELENKEDLYLPSTKVKMNKILKEIYNACISTPPSCIRADKDHGHRIVSNFIYNSKNTRAAFNGNGTLITLYEVYERY